MAGQLSTLTALVRQIAQLASMPATAAQTPPLGLVVPVVDSPVTGGVVVAPSQTSAAGALPVLTTIPSDVSSLVAPGPTLGAVVGVPMRETETPPSLPCPPALQEGALPYRRRGQGQGPNWQNFRSTTRPSLGRGRLI